MSREGPRKIGEGVGWAMVRKGGKEIAAAINTGQAQIVQETGDMWNPPHAQIHKETGWDRQADQEKSQKEFSAGRDELYGKQQEQEQEMEMEM